MTEQYWALVPAAGVGRRMRADRPKQYLRLGERTVLEHTLDALWQVPAIAGAVVVRSAEDPFWPQLKLWHERPLWAADGGAERADSVMNGLAVLAAHADTDDWVLVHDAARPCLRRGDVERLIEALRDDPVGGLLAVPVRDTMKAADEGGRVAETLDRSRLWHALTPQMFRLGALRDALQAARAAGRAVTDEASAMEAAGLAPRLVEGHADNIKITRPEDLALAEFFLRAQGRL
ncbi:2-C-methyl-D-erythritol 4-phosphate cytidylyltransferase [Thiohalobacter sp.]|uniref:2-C-methyl-D-erythritol 4-phosphate cytidylyltransferase n=1 Tax=Thiohalobacter sp. TaxID=2025948 RepID=UPI002610CFE6|nr:2-C-methyl-D-erythritol 4-phosphate cytidylyltransferase [Thiohalobacter sp.]